MGDHINCILGTMTFGSQVDHTEGRKMIELFVQAGYQEIDTAYVYNDGITETLLGTLLEDPSVPLATKVHPQLTGKLDGSAVSYQVRESLSRLGRKMVDILYLHIPDLQTPVEEALRECANLHDQGLINEIGLSNYPAWMVSHIWHVCEARGWPKPTVYQGMYNGISRQPEAELFPALRHFGMRFYAYNPLAGGILTGRHQDYSNRPDSGRFAIMPAYQERYWKRAIFSAVRTINEECNAVGIPLAAAAIRWLIHHSTLDQQFGDGIIVGASNLKQLQENITAMSAPPLPERIVQRFDQAWEIAKADSPAYFRHFVATK
jgi:aflatoxin B1 aldehyde reductase